MIKTFIIALVAIEVYQIIVNVLTLKVKEYRDLKRIVVNRGDYGDKLIKNHWFNGSLKEYLNFYIFGKWPERILYAARRGNRIDYCVERNYEKFKEFMDEEDELEKDRTKIKSYPIRRIERKLGHSIDD